ncbi:MAG: hypothetical protein ACREEE_15815 [Dongiaceae bacterium]
MNVVRALALCAAVLGLLLAAGTTPARTAAFEDGEIFYTAGQLRKAYEVWLPLADAGSCRAQFGVSQVIQELGVSYLLYGEVESDDSWAYRTFREGWKRYNLWFTWRLRAAQQGHAEARQWFAEQFWDDVDGQTWYDVIVFEESQDQPEPSPEEIRRRQRKIAAYTTIAWTWTLLAADSGHPEAMLSLSDRTRARGEVAEGIKWYILAAYSDYAPYTLGWEWPPGAYSAERRAMAEAERRAAAWRAAHADLRPWGPCD